MSTVSMIMISYSHMRRMSAFFIAIMTVSMLFGSAGVVFADDGCECWCKTSDGAQQVEGKETVDSSTDCRTACDDSGWGYSMCSTTGSSPADNDKCWSQYECENNMAEIDGAEVPYEWDTTQAKECINGESYCYRPAEAVELSVLIGETTEVDSIGDYINVAYNFLLPAGAMLAVVMLMIAGLQYMVARGNPDRIGKAKTRIRNAVTGIILLLLAATFAQFMDPALTNLNRLTPPAIRTVVFIDPDSTCEAMTAAGLTITADVSGQENCGDTGTIADTGDVEATVQVGDPCKFTGCEGDFYTCVATTVSDTGFDCLRCREVYSTITGSVGADPGSSMCGRLLDTDKQDELLAEASSTDTAEKLYCIYYDAPVLDNSFNACTEIVYPDGSDTLDCAALRQDALADDSYGCRAYDLVQSAYEAGDESLFDDGYTNEIDDRLGADDDFPLLTQICESDPCGLGPDNGEGCRVFTSATDIEEISDEALANMSITDQAALSAILAGDTIADWLGGAAVDTFANCANSTSAYGWYYCKDVYGNEVDCNPTW